MTDPGSSCLEPSARIVRGGGDATGNTTHTAIPLIGGAVMNIAKHCGLAPLPLPAAPGGMGGILGGSGSGTGPACGHWGSDNGGGGWQVGLRGGGIEGEEGAKGLGRGPFPRPRPVGLSRALRQNATQGIDGKCVREEAPIGVIMHSPIVLFTREKNLSI